MNLKINTTLFAAAACAALLSAALPRAARAEGKDQLWEVTSKMSMPDMPKSKHHHEMPEGMMGGMMSEHKQQICRGEDPREEVTKNKKMEDCSVADFKEDGNTITMEVKCKKGRGGKMELKYNKERTAYTGTMHMTDEGHEMQMTMNGRKIGTCDAKAARAERQAKVDAIKAQAESSQAQYKEMMRRSEEEQIKGCAKAVEKMSPETLSFYGSCYHKSDANCKTMVESTSKQQPKVAAACTEKADLLCKRFPTYDGYVAAQKSSSLDRVADMCGKPADEVREKLCKTALKDEAYEFIGGSCPSVAKPLVKSHCAGRSYTVKEGDPRRVEKKWFKFCVAVAGSNLGEDETASEKPSKGDAASKATGMDPEEQAAKAKEDAKNEMKKEAIGAGLKKLSGLFGH